MNRIADIKLLVKGNRYILIKFVVLVSIVFSILNLAIEKIGLNTLSIIVLIVFNYIISIYFAYILKYDLVRISFTSFMDMMKKHSKGIIFIAVIQFIIMLSWLIVLKLLSGIKYVVLFIQPLTLVFYVLLNYINFKLIYNIFDCNKIDKKTFKKILSNIKDDKKIIFYLFLKTFTIIVIGCICIYLIIIFVYAKQIDSAINNVAVVNEALINSYFSSTLSNFIQSFGAQIISGLVLIWIGNASLFLENKR